MPVIIKLPRAKSDLVEIWDYIADDSEARVRDELAEGLRSFAVGRYVIFYRPISEGVEIVRVLHGSRDIDAIFQAAD